MTTGTIRLIAGCAALAAALALFAMPPPARAADPVFPTGYRVGMVPPPGMTLSGTFPGFEDQAKDATVLLGALPGDAYAAIDKTTSVDELKKQGMTVEKREPFPLAIGKGILVVGTQVAADKTQLRKWMLVAAASDLTALASVQVPLHSTVYTDQIVRAALATLTVRDKVPEQEYLSLVPFTVGDLAGFRIANVMPGRALMLVDRPNAPHMIVTAGVPRYALDGQMMIVAVAGGPTTNEDRATFARMAFNSIAGIKDVQLTMSEPVRIDNREAYETVARAKDVRTDGNVMVVQWLRFGNGGFVQVVGISRADVWDSELARMRDLRDSIHFKTAADSP